MSERPFGRVNIGAEMAVTLGSDPRPYLTKEQTARQLQITDMTLGEWNAAWEDKLSSDESPF